MNKIYVATYSNGSWDDYHTIEVFASHDKELVLKWVDKFNNKLKHWQEYFGQFSNEWNKSSIKDEYFMKINYDTFCSVMDCNGASIMEIELR